MNICYFINSVRCNKVQFEVHFKLSPMSHVRFFKTERGKFPVLRVFLLARAFKLAVNFYNCILAERRIVGAWCAVIYTAEFKFNPRLWRTVREPRERLNCCNVVNLFFINVPSSNLFSIYSEQQKRNFGVMMNGY